MVTRAGRHVGHKVDEARECIFICGQGALYPGLVPCLEIEEVDVPVCLADQHGVGRDELKRIVASMFTIQYLQATPPQPNKSLHSAKASHRYSQFVFHSGDRHQGKLYVLSVIVVKSTKLSVRTTFFRSAIKKRTALDFRTNL